MIPFPAGRVKGGSRSLQRRLQALPQLHGLELHLDFLAALHHLTLPLRQSEQGLLLGGGGKNWWCVVFPPLCTTAACDFQETAVSGGLGEEDLSLITEEDGGYVLRFRAVELWEGLRQWLGKH